MWIAWIGLVVLGILCCGFISLIGVGITSAVLEIRDELDSCENF